MADDFSLAAIASIIRGDPYLSQFDIQVLEVSRGRAKLLLPASDKVLRHGGILNGGAIATLMDASGGTATATVNTGINQVTIELKVNYLEAMKKGNAYCEARVIRAGRNIVVCEMDVTDESGKLCAKGIGTWMILYSEHPAIRQLK